MKKLLISLLLVAVGAIAFVILGDVDSGDHLTVKQEEGNEKLYIGVFEPLTGIYAHGGNQELLGLEYAQSVRPTVTVGGKDYDIEFVIADNASEPVEATAGAERLAASEIRAVIGSYGSALSVAGGEVFAREGIPAIGASCSSQAVTEGNDWYFRVCFSDSFQGRVLANFAYGQGIKSVAAAAQAGDAYSRGLCDVFTEEFEKLGGETHRLSFNGVQKNFEPLLEEMDALEIDAVFIPSADSSAAIFINQARESGVSLPIIGGDSWDTATLISEIAPYGENVFFTSSFDPNDPEDPTATGFAAKFEAWVAADEERRERNGGALYTAPQSALAYDAYMLLMDAIEKGDSFQPADIAAYLSGMSFSGVTGAFTFDQDGNSGKTTAFVKSVNTNTEEFEVLRTYSGAG